MTSLISLYDTNLSYMQISFSLGNRLFLQHPPWTGCPHKTIWIVPKPTSLIRLRLLPFTLKISLLPWLGLFSGLWIIPFCPFSSHFTQLSSHLFPSLLFKHGKKLILCFVQKCLLYDWDQNQPPKYALPCHALSVHPPPPRILLHA